MIDRIDTLWVCQDCMVVLETDETGLDDARQAEVETAITKLTAGGKQLLSDNSEEEGRDEFSWKPCHCCRSPLGGSRYRYGFFQTLRCVTQVFPGENDILITTEP